MKYMFNSSIQMADQSDGIAILTCSAKTISAWNFGAMSKMKPELFQNDVMSPSFPVQKNIGPRPFSHQQSEIKILKFKVDRPAQCLNVFTRYRRLNMSDYNIVACTSTQSPSLTVVSHNQLCHLRHTWHNSDVYSKLGCLSSTSPTRLDRTVM